MYDHKGTGGNDAPRHHGLNQCMSVLDANAIGCSYPSEKMCETTAPKPYAEAPAAYFNSSIGS